MARLEDANTKLNEKSVFLHLGFGRTATTWLQNSLFPDLHNVNYLGKSNESYPRWLIDWNYLDRLLLPEKIETIRNNIYKKTTENKILISSEAFTQTASIVDQIERIKSVIQSPRIIIILREPTSLVVSKYRRLRMAGFFNEEIEHYLDYSHTPYDLVRRGRLYLYDYNYPLVIERLNKEFGEKCVFFKKYETLKSNPQKFVSDLVSFLGVQIPSEVDFQAVNSSNAEIRVNPETILKIKTFFSNLFDYSDIVES